jgi:hypothetical protein
LRKLENGNKNFLEEKESQWRLKSRALWLAIGGSKAKSIKELGNENF